MQKIRIATITLSDDAWRSFRGWLGRQAYDDVAGMVAALDAGVVISEEEIIEEQPDAQKDGTTAPLATYPPQSGVTA